jgi:hypothetical protein
MKTTITSTLAILGLCTGLATAAYSQAPDYTSTPAPQRDANGAIVVMPPYAVRSDIPQPLETIPLNVGPEYAGRQVDMLFWVDKNGRAYNIDADTSNLPDRYTNVKTASLVTQLAVAISGWKFEPAHDANGNAIDRHVRLPISMTDQTSSTVAYTSN